MNRRHDIDALRALAAALVLFAGYLAFRLASPGDEWAAGASASRLLRDLYLWGMIVAVLGYAHAHLNRPPRWLPWTNESVYPWYLLHQTLIIAIAHLAGPSGSDRCWRPRLCWPAPCWAAG